MIPKYRGAQAKEFLLWPQISPAIANAIGSTVIELMGESETPEIKKRGPKSKLELQIEQINQLPRAKQKFVTEMLDTVIQQQQ